MAPLEDVDPNRLRDLLDEVEGAVPAQRLMLGLTYLEEPGATQAELARRYGLSEGTVNNWLARLDDLDEGAPEAVLANESPPGKPRAISDDQFERLRKALRAPPEAAGYDASAWTTALVQEFVETEFGVEYSRRHVRRLMREIQEG